MTDRSQINVRLPSEQKRDWKDHVADDDAIGSLSELIRHAVTQYISDDPDPTPADGGASVSVDTSDIERSLNRIEKQVQDMAEDVQVMRTNTPKADMIARHQPVLDAIPRGGGPDDGATVVDIAKESNTDIMVAHGVLGSAYEDSNSLERETIGSDTYYWTT
jgi:Arc/MetJ-type ribon-helix-helix transcriptional regulator